MTGCGTCDAASGSVAGGLRHRSRSGGRLVERAVHLLERAALGFGPNLPDPNLCNRRDLEVQSTSGTVRPSALAVLRLITSWNLVGCWTGRSAGLAPFRILS